MQGDQIKALKIISRAKGWDPDVLAEKDAIGLPVNIQRRAGAWDPGAASYKAEESPVGQKIDWETGATDDGPNRATKNANPVPGKVGA